MQEINTKKLIELLKEADPEGTAIPCFNNVAVTDVEVEPAYWEGKLHVVALDNDGRYVSGRITSKGFKVSISACSLHDLVSSSPSAPIDLSELDKPQQKWWKKSLDESIELQRDTSYRAELENFQEHMLERVKSLGWDGNLRDAKRCIQAVFNKHVKIKILPDDLKSMFMLWSWHDRREIQWLREFDVTLMGAGFSIALSQDQYRRVKWVKYERFTKARDFVIDILDGMSFVAVLPEEPESETWLVDNKESNGQYLKSCETAENIMAYGTSSYLPAVDGRGPMRKLLFWSVAPGKTSITLGNTVTGETMKITFNVIKRGKSTPCTALESEIDKKEGAG